MRVGWLIDTSAYVGGAELTEREQRAAAPKGVKVDVIGPENKVTKCDRYILHNIVQFTAEALAPVFETGVPVFKYWNDVGAWVYDDVKQLIGQHARQICCSPAQAEYMGLQEAECVPPPVDLGRFESAAASSNGSRRKGSACCVASWRNAGKNPNGVLEWASAMGVTVDFFGAGPFAPPGAQEVAYPGMPHLLSAYETFVFLPAVIEPFGRSVVEAWAAGCDLVVNDLVGAKGWIEHDEQALWEGAKRFWEVVTS